MSTLTLTHRFHDRVIAQCDAKPLFEYVYVPQGPQTESLKPYFAPIYTLAGDDVTIFRPHDHPWHRGLQMTFTAINDQNFWGGNTYIPESERYTVMDDRNLIRAESGRPYDPDIDSYALFDNVGRTEHQYWRTMTCDGDRIDMEHTLDWITSRGETWLRERRRLQVQNINRKVGYWTLAWHSIFENVSGIPLEIGTPTTMGRPNAGYGGLFWRGPRSFSDSPEVKSSNPDVQDIMGKKAEWLAYSGIHDSTLRHSTLIFQDMPGNPRYPTQWFVRERPFAGVSLAFMFDEVYTLLPGTRMELHYRIIIANDRLSDKQIQSCLSVTQ